MKIFFDLFPVIVFFIAFKFGDIYAATAVAMAATLIQIILIAIKHKKVEPMQWASLVLIMIFGGLTIGLQDKTFIQWKPTILYWLFSIGLIGSAVILKKNLIQAAMAHQVTLKPGVSNDLWKKLNNAWAIFFAVMGCMNLYVAYQYDEATWVNFKLFGSMGILFIFIIAQGIWLNKFVIHDKK
jgi:intracellular septation protein